jgi:hypothetical protein
MRVSTGHYPKGWRKIARAAIERAGNKCERCGKPNGTGRGNGLNCHHLDWDRSNCLDWNLVSVCVKCHFYVQHQNQLQQVWMISKEAWLQPHIRGYIEWVAHSLCIPPAPGTR